MTGLKLLGHFLPVLCAILPASALAQNPFAQMGAARAAIIAKDTAKAFALLDSLRAVTPHHPNYLYLRAHANGMAGRHSQARADIEQLLKWDPRYARSALRDTTVASLRSTFAHVDSLARSAEQAVSTGSVWATIGERDLVPEGTAWDPVTRSVLIGSLNKHKIIAIAPDGTVSDRVAPGASGLRSVAGIHVDSARRTLWAASNARYDTPADSTASLLYGFDAATGAVKTRIKVPGAEKHFLNDITTGSDGTVYVTDTQAGRVWFASPGSTELRELLALGKVTSPNGITISTDGRVLFVADVDHVKALDISSRRTWRVAIPDTVNVSGIDGLAFHQNALIAHHPLSYWRVARYQLDPTWQRIIGRRIIDANTPDIRTSTTGEIAGDDYIYIGNSQIDRMNAKTIDASTMEPIRIYRAVKISSASSSSMETVRIDGSPALAPLARALADAYRAVRPSSVVTVGGGLGSRERIDAARQGRIDIALASQVVPSELATQGLAAHEIAKSAVVFAVNAGVPVTSLSSRQICDAYRGGITNWRELGGPDLPLAVRTRPPAEVDAAIVLAGIECFRAASSASTVARVIDRPEEMAAELASVPGALGMTSMPFVEQSGSRIKALALDGIRPDAESVRGGKYSLTRSSFLVTSASPSAAVAQFIAFVRSDAGARIIRANGAVPIP